MIVKDGSNLFKPKVNLADTFKLSKPSGHNIQPPMDLAAATLMEVGC
jgi:hypothetical protein